MMKLWLCKNELHFDGEYLEDTGILVSIEEILIILHVCGLSVVVVEAFVEQIVLEIYMKHSKQIDENLTALHYIHHAFIFILSHMILR